MVTLNLFDEFIVGLYRLTLTVLVTTIDAQWEGMGDVGSARYEPALIPPCPTIRVSSYSKLVNFQKFSTLRVNVHTYHSQTNTEMLKKGC